VFFEKRLTKSTAVTVHSEDEEIVEEDEDENVIEPIGEDNTDKNFPREFYT